MTHEFNIVIKSQFQVGDIVRVKDKEWYHYKDYKNQLFKITSIDYYIEDECISLENTTTIDENPYLECTIENIKDKTIIPYFPCDELKKATKKDKVKYL